MSGFSPDFAVAEVRPSPNFGARVGVEAPDMIILHYTGMASGKAAEDWLCNPEAQVSSHYLVHEDGRVVQMVRESDRAWHAGRSSWHGTADINSRSVGIEIVNPGHDLGYRPFPRRQIGAVIALCQDIMKRQGIAPDLVLAHSDVAPGRKVDPGERFPWRQLARAGVGVIVTPSRATRGPSLAVGAEGEDVIALQEMLARFGYGIAVTGSFDHATQIVVAAFQRHYRPAQVDGVTDPATVATLRRLLAQNSPA